MLQTRDRIIVLGWYGSSNTGDEALVQTIVNALHARNLRNLVVLSINPENTQQKLGVRAVRRNLLTLGALRELKGANALVLGGGGLIQDGTSVYNLPIYAAYVALARLFGLQVIGWGLGAEFLVTTFGRLLARFICHSSIYFSVRDTASKLALVQAGAQPIRIKVTTDPAMALALECHRDTWPKDGRPTVIFCIRHLPVIRPGINLFYFLPVSLRHKLRLEWQQNPDRVENLVQSLAHGIRVAVNDLRARVVLLSFWPGRDDGMIDLVEKAALKLAVPQEAMRRAPLQQSPGQYLSYIGEADLLVSMRLHALIFGSQHGVPSLALSYAGKVRSMMRELGAERWTLEIERRAPAPDEVGLMLRELWEQRVSEGDRLRRSAADARRAAEADADEIAKLLTTG
jgi:polysaccharide pyruvyl transferase WcaK-like protein